MKDNNLLTENMSSEIKISIITINLNNADGLKQTLRSIFEQENIHFDNLESIVIDGGSKDSSKDVIESFKDKISFFLSEKDNGIYDAMNKGISYAKGNYIWFMNSGDYFTDKCSLCKFIQIIDESDYYDLIYSDIYLFSQNKLKKRIQPNNITYAHLMKSAINHQSYILKRRHFEIKENFRLDYKLISDWIFLFELFKKKTISTYKINLPLVIYNDEGISISSGTLWLEERSQYLKSVYSHWELSCLYKFARLNTKPYFENLIKTLDSPKRTGILTFILNIMIRVQSKN